MSKDIQLINDQAGYGASVNLITKLSIFPLYYALQEFLFKVPLLLFMNKNQSDQVEPLSSFYSYAENGWANELGMNSQQKCWIFNEDNAVIFYRMTKFTVFHHIF